MPRCGRTRRSRVALRGARKLPAFDVGVIPVECVGQHRLAIDVAADESRSMVAGNAPEILQDQHLAVGAWTRTDADGRNREFPGDARPELRRNAFEHQRETAQFLKRMCLPCNLLRVFRIAPLHAEAAELVDRLRCQANVPHDGYAGSDDMPDDILVTVNAFEFDRVRAASHEGSDGADGR